MQSNVRRIVICFSLVVSCLCGADAFGQNRQERISIMSRYNSVGSALVSFPSRGWFAQELIDRNNRQNAVSRRKAFTIGTFDDDIFSEREIRFMELFSDTSFHSTLAWWEGKSCAGYTNDGLDEAEDAAIAMGINNGGDFAFIDVASFLNLVNDATINWAFVSARVAAAEVRMERAYRHYVTSLQQAALFESKLDDMESMLP